MKKLEVTQEVMLLRDAVVSTEMQGLNFEHEASAQVSAIMIKDAVQEIRMMLNVDGRTSSEKREAESNMHSLIFYTTMMRNEHLEKEFSDDVKYVCKSLTRFGMCTYIECVRACSWQEFAKESWLSASEYFQQILFREILQTILSLKDEILLDIWHFSIENLIILWCKDYKDEDNDDIEIRGSLIMTVINNSVENIVRHLQWSFIIKLCDLVALSCHKLTDISVERYQKTAVSLIVACIEAIIRILKSNNEVWPDEVINKLSCVENAAIKNEKISFMLNNFGPLNYVNLWHENISVRFRDLEESVNEYERITSDIKVINSRLGRYEDALDNLVARTPGDLDFTILQCLMENSDLITPTHILRLVGIFQCTNLDHRKQLEEIIEKAFCSWPLKVQDSFRETYHKERGLQNNLGDEDSYTNRLTTAINKLSSRCEDDSVFTEFSYLCFCLPVQTLTMLLNHAIENGRDKNISKILLHLTSSCNFKTAQDNSFLVQYFENITKEQLESQKLGNVLTCIKALIEEKVLDVRDLMMKLILPNMIPVTNCNIFLKIFQTILACDDEMVNEQISALSPSIIVWQLSKLVHYCMTATLRDAGNFIDLKGEVISTVGLLTNCIIKNKVKLKDHEICWLWTKHQNIKNVVICYWHKVFVSHNTRLLYEEKVHQLPLAEFLLSNCLKNSSSTKPIPSVYFENSSTGSSAFRLQLILAVVQILPRMTADEVLRLISYLSFIQGRYKFHDSKPKHSLIPLIHTVSILMDSLVLLSRASNDLTYVQHLKYTIQITTASIKTAVLEKDKTPSGYIPGDTFVSLISLCQYLASNLNETFLETIKILILDFTRELRTNGDLSYADMALKIIYSLKDRQLSDQAEVLLKV